jgi:hypothetical protein
LTISPGRYKLQQDGEEKIFFTDPLFVFVVSGRMLIDQREKVGSRMQRLQKQHKASEKSEMIEKMRALGTERLPSLTFEALVRKQGEGFDMSTKRGQGSRKSKAKTSLRSLLGDVTKGRWRKRSVVLHFSADSPNMYIFKLMVGDIDESVANDQSAKSAPVEGSNITLEGDNFEGQNNVVRIGVRRWTNKGSDIMSATEFVIAFKSAGEVEQFTRWVEWSSSLVSAKAIKKRDAGRAAAGSSGGGAASKGFRSASAGGGDEEEEIADPTWREFSGPNLRGSLSDFWRVVGRVGTMDIARRGAMLYRARADMSVGSAGAGPPSARSASGVSPSGSSAPPPRRLPPPAAGAAASRAARVDSGALLLQRSDLDDLTRAWLTAEFVRNGDLGGGAQDLSQDAIVPAPRGEGAGKPKVEINETDEFFYTDDLGKEHGPFSVEMLREWFKAGCVACCARCALWRAPLAVAVAVCSRLSSVVRLSSASTSASTSAPRPPPATLTARRG